MHLQYNRTDVTLHRYYKHVFQIDKCMVDEFRLYDFLQVEIPICSICVHRCVAISIA